MPELDILQTLVVLLGSFTPLFVGQHDGKPVETCHASYRTHDSPWFRFKTNIQVDFFIRFISGKKVMTSLYRYRDTRPMTCGMGVGAIRRIRIFLFTPIHCVVIHMSEIIRKSLIDDRRRRDIGFPSLMPELR